MVSILTSDSFIYRKQLDDTMRSRRDFIKTTATGASPWPECQPQPLAVLGIARTPRFIFLRKSNGTFPSELVPPTLSASDRKKEENTSARPRS